MAESRRDELEEGRNKEKRTSISLLIPWSCREGFTNEVCGLPGSTDGCWRYRETESNKNVVEGNKGIRPCSLEELTEPLVGWIVFESPVDSDGIVARVEKSKPPFTGSHHQALFGFTKDGLDAFRAQSESGCYPNYVEYNGADGRSSERIDVKGWLPEKLGEKGLSDCFGHHAFVPQEIQGAAALGPNLDRLSLSDLIRSYLNHNRGCDFRKSESARGVGITVCKVGVGLSKTVIRENQPVDGKALDLLSTSAVSFSYVDTETLTIKKLPEWCIGRHDANVNEALRSVSDQYFVPLSVRLLDSNAGESEINFATSLSQRGRQNILPSEVGKSFLSFPVGEISSYLLHWLLLRIFADDSPQNAAFVESFDRWRKLVEAGNSATQPFSDLLALPVTLSLDTNVFREAVTTLEGKEQYLGLYESPVSFGEALGVLGLSNGDYDAWIYTTREFLNRFFNPDPPSQNFQQLPMYRNLKWKESPLLGQVVESSTKSAQIEAIVACVANASGLTTDLDRKATALAELRKHSQRSVFPIADILANLPFEIKMPLYYIFPLWEDTIRDAAGAEWRGPVIFAHVFTRALHSRLNDSLPHSKAIIETGEQLQSLLLPAGAAIAHDYYNKERKNIERLRLAKQTAWKLARAWAHEVKNYTAPVIDELDNPILSDKRIVVSDKARETIVRSRRTILILNAASTAVQLSLGSRVDESAVKASELNALKKLPRDSAEGIVEYALQYLLNYRADVVRADFNLSWSPRYTTDQTLDHLALILKKEAREDEKRILSDNRLIWVIALLRELVWNIRIDDPFVEAADQLGTVEISYSFELEDSFLQLIVTQRQIQEKPWSQEKAKVTGIELANSVFGIEDKGAGFGLIGKGKIQNNDLGRGRGVEMTYTVPISFALVPKINT